MLFIVFVAVIFTLKNNHGGHPGPKEIYREHPEGSDQSLLQELFPVEQRGLGWRLYGVLLRQIFEDAQSCK